jgi:hypothetical protein
MKYETAGDPMSELKWTRKTTAKIVEELALIDISVSKTTIGKIIKSLNFSLKTNVKSIANGGKLRTKKENEKRNDQFEYINAMIKKYTEKGLPTVSIDTKKKEPIGNFKNPGTRL